MIWTFGAGPKIFIYESAVLVVGYSYGYFTNKDMLKVGAAAVDRRLRHPAAARAALLAAHRHRAQVISVTVVDAGRRLPARSES